MKRKAMVPAVLTYLTQAHVNFAISQTRIYGVNESRHTTPDAIPLAGYLAGTLSNGYGRSWLTSMPLLERK